MGVASIPASDVDGIAEFIVCVNFIRVPPPELLELWPQSQRDVQRLQHGALLRLLLPAQGLGEAPSRLRPDAAGPAAAAAGRPAAGGRPGLRDPRPHQLLRLHPEQRDRESGRHPARRDPPLLHPQHPVLRCPGRNTALMAIAELAARRGAA